MAEAEAGFTGLNQPSDNGFLAGIMSPLIWLNWDEKMFIRSITSLRAREQSPVPGVLLLLFWVAAVACNIFLPRYYAAAFSYEPGCNLQFMPFTTTQAAWVGFLRLPCPSRHRHPTNHASVFRAQRGSAQGILLCDWWAARLLHWPISHSYHRILDLKYYLIATSSDDFKIGR